MAFIRQLTSSTSETTPTITVAEQTGAMSGTYEIQVGAQAIASHKIQDVSVVAPIDQNNQQQQHHQPQQQDPKSQQQQTVQPQNQEDSNATIIQEGTTTANNSNNNNNPQSSSSGSEDQSRNNDSSLQGGLDASGVNKTPNSYKYPLLKKYFEFGPWVGRNRKALCLGCHLQTSSSQPDRLLKHLNRCNGLSDDEKVLVCDLMNERTANKRKRPANLVGPRRRNEDGEEYYNEDEHNSSLADELAADGLPANNSITVPSTAAKRRRDTMDKNSQIDEALTRFIINCRIPLRAIHSREFIEFVRALNPDYRIPSRETITNVLIPGLLNII